MNMVKKNGIFYFCFHYARNPSFLCFFDDIYLLKDDDDFELRHVANDQYQV